MTALSAQIPRSALRDAVGKLLPLMESGRNAHPVTKHVLIESTEHGLRFTGTNFDSYVRLEVPCEISTAGRVLLPAKRLSEIAANLPDGALVSMKTKANILVTITAGRARFEVTGLAVSDFPLFQAIDGETTTVNAAAFVDAVTRAAKHAGNQQGRENLHAVRIAHEDGRTVAVATTGQHLARIPITADTTLRECSLHTSALPLLSRLFGGLAPDATLTLAANDGKLQVSSLTATALLPFNANVYPYWQNVIVPTGAHRIRCDRAALMASVARVALATAENRRVTITMNGDLTLSAEHEDGRAEDVMPVESHEGDGAITVLLHADFLRTALMTLTDERVCIAIETPDRAVHLTNASQAADDATLVLVMPLR